MSDDFEQLRPTLILLAVLIVSALLGYIWGATSVSVVDTGMWQLEPSYQGIYMQAVADGYALDSNEALAVERLSFLCQQTKGDNPSQLQTAMEQAQLRYGADPQKAANLDQVQTLIDSGAVVQNEAVAVCNTKPIGTGPQAGRLLAPILLVLGFLGLLGYGLMQAGMLPFGVAAEEAPEREEAGTPVMESAVSAEETIPAAPVKPEETASPPTAEETAPRRSPLAGLPFVRRREEEEGPRSPAQRGTQLSKQAEKTDFQAIGQDPPLVQFMTTYLHGDDLYDDSFSIETQSGEFLGETGVGISETVSGTGDAKNVTALEVWLFDKNDIRTVTKVLMSDHAYNDEAIRARLAPKGEAVLLRPGDKIPLKTATLEVQGRIVDLSYRPDSMPPNSVIDRITIELAAWRRDAAPMRSRAFPGGRDESPSGGGPV
jgi:hypothetical protein